MTILYRNARILTMDGALGTFFGDLLTDGDKIAAVGDLSGAAADRIIDCAGDILMPSLVDTHAHLAMTVMRNAADDLKLWDWLYKRIFPMEAKLDPGLVRAGTRLGAAELISGGVTGAVDMYMYPDVVREVLEESGMEGVICDGENDLDGDIPGHLAHQEKNLAAATDRVKSMLSFHAEYTCSADYLDGIAALSQESHTGVMAHNSETLEEVGTCCTKHNDLSPTMYMHSMGLLDYGGLMAHCVYCDKEDFTLLKQCGCAVSLNCASNMKLGSGIPPILTMKEAGLLLSLGTDSAASNNRLDLWREMYLAAILPKGALNKPDAVSAPDVLTWATADGARVIGSNGGTLAVGSAANLIRVSVSKLGMTPLGEIPSALVYGAGRSDVVMTVCRGKVLYENGRFCNGWDETKIRSEAAEASAELLRRTV